MGYALARKVLYTYWYNSVTRNSSSCHVRKSECTDNIYLGWETFSKTVTDKIFTFCASSYLFSSLSLDEPFFFYGTEVLRLLRRTNPLNDDWNKKFANARTFTKDANICNARLSNRWITICSSKDVTSVNLKKAGMASRNIVTKNNTTLF